MKTFPEEIQKCIPNPHPARAIIRENKLPISVVANYCGYTLNFMYLVLSGSAKASAAAEKKLQKLVRILEDGGDDNG